MSLVVTDLACRRAGRRVLDGVGFALAPGGTLVLRGPNGAGKSTLLRALAGLLPPERGGATLDGHLALGDDPDGWAERIAYAGHLDAVKAQLTVAENLRFWAALLGADATAEAEALDAFALAPITSRLAGACSAGQRRRLGLARLALAPRRLWLLDEPTVSLDAEAAERLAAMIASHSARGGMTVVATHVALGVDGSELRLLPPAAASTAAADPFLA
ncbi:heme ABC exporter ATP-binding protein CcmA [Amaricoccus sp.]|uniref:heme ABC exporter ATP-binding protein CcmA n=1 Tax=Amaricoccus sp. TaxID=1872485 RepID=UPI001B65211B|nr:heme ABC exporter ATP-binding protein CcmA [Amaricoccus sp.]MBP7243463.1 heme ABC exporter ATP-binding protein CcmA [Amaricoccus sp.]